MPPEPSRAYARYVLGVMFLLTALNVMDRQVLAALAEPVKAEFGLSDTVMGILLGSAFGFAHFVAMVPAGRLADRGSRRNVLSGGLFLWSALTAVTGLVAAAWQLFVTRVGVAIGETVGSGPAQSLLSDYFPVDRRGGALSIHASGGTLGAMIGSALGATIGQAFGWRWAFVFFGVPGLLLAVVLLTTVREPARGATDGIDADEAVPPLREVLSTMLRLRSFRHLLVAGSLNCVANYALLAWASAAMMRAHDLSLAEAGSRVGFQVMMISAIGVIVAGLITDRLGARDVRWYLWWPGIASAGAFPFLAAFLLVPDPDVAFLVAMPGAFLNTMWVGTFNATVHLLARPSMRATSASLFAMVTSGLMGQGLGPAAVGFLSDVLGPAYGADSLRYALALALAVSVWAAAHSLLAARTLREDRFVTRDVAR